MADLNKLKTRFGDPPQATEAKGNLRQPEEPAWVDGRTLRAKGRTSQLATRIDPALHQRAKVMAAQDGITMAELIETGIELYAAKKRAATAVKRPAMTKRPLRSGPVPAVTASHTSAPAMPAKRPLMGTVVR